MVFGKFWRWDFGSGVYLCRSRGEWLQELSFTPNMWCVVAWKTAKKLLIWPLSCSKRCWYNRDWPCQMDLADSKAATQTITRSHSSMVGHLITTQEVVGSSPTEIAFWALLIQSFKKVFNRTLIQADAVNLQADFSRSHSSTVEHLSSKQGVVGSAPTEIAFFTIWLFSRPD